MPEPRPRQISRRTVVGTAWAAPVLLAAVTAPAAAASETMPTLTLTVSPPYKDGNTTWFVIRVTNDGTTDIPGGALLAYLPLTDASYWYSGFSGEVAWNYGPDDPTGESLTFAYDRAVPAGDTAGTLLLILGRTDPDQTPAPVATLTFSAPGYTSASAALRLE
ncbi:hypothetical protein NVV95_12925 [Herbiconiux sp. CPCC 205716]|uniref:DUF11 domain-containing protein n=1 Tax=Herbiconiux gentiana TaxID=2970912 RepID=A0ABT2GH67_9MICO|nr:hypothetical protein [Herbiconiux gentiana]MCS5715446.1 hypothetical protein [Herbiconiux gentiana]